MAGKIKKVSVVDQVADEIKKEIVNGVWSEGDKIPSEGEFAESFGVNRLSVRLALEKLNTLGLIETRVGEGSFVKRMSLAPVFNELEGFYNDGESNLDIMQFRYLLESDSLRRAEKFATDEEKQKLKRKLQEYNDSLTSLYEDPDNEERLNRTVESDFAFHYQIVKMSHNRLYADLYYMIRRLVLRHMATQVGPRSRMLKEMGYDAIYKNEGHQRMYDAIISGDDSEIEDICSQMVGIYTQDELKDYEGSTLETTLL